jgi:hypothetical protein
MFHILHLHLDICSVNKFDYGIYISTEYKSQTIYTHNTG